MTATLAVVLALLSQEVDSLQAVSRMVDRAATAREEVEAAAARLPEGFYRTVLEGELKARPLPLKRASFDFKDQPPVAVFTEIASRFGERIELNHFRAGGVGAAGVTLKLEEASLSEALAAALRGAKSTLFYNGTELVVHPFQEALGICPYRNSLVLLPNATRSRKIEFGAGETRSLRFTLMLIWDSCGDVVRVNRARVTEAIDDKRRTIPPLPAEPEAPRPARKESDPVYQYINRWVQHEVSLEFSAAEKLDRLRGFFDVSVAGEFSAFELGDLEKGSAKSDDHYEVQASRKPEGGRATILLRIKPKGTLEAFLNAPVEVFGSGSALREAPVGGGGTATVRGQAEIPLYSQGCVKDGGVEYILVGTGVPADTPKDFKSLRIRIHRAPVERRIPFEFRDLPLK